MFRQTGVIGSNRNFITNIINSLIARPRAALRRGEDLPPPDPAARKALMLGVPLFHATGNHSSLGVCTAMGFKVRSLASLRRQSFVNHGTYKGGHDLQVALANGQQAHC